MMDEAPDVDRICLSVIASEKISIMCAIKQILAKSPRIYVHREAHHCPQNPSRGIVSTKMSLSDKIY